MIEAQYIIDSDKSLLTIRFNNQVMNHLKISCNDYINFYQSKYKFNRMTIFKSDTGYKVVKVLRKKNMYQIYVRQLLEEIGEFDFTKCTYFLKKYGLIKIIINE